MSPSKKTPCPKCSGPKERKAVNCKKCASYSFHRSGGRIHKMSFTPTYTAWRGPKARCLNPNEPQYKHYGGRGIKVCDRWLSSFQNFLADMGEKPKGTTLDRVNVNGDYEPGNCRWVDWKVQQNNRRNNRLLTYEGVTLNATQWAERLGMDLRVIQKRVAAGWNDSSVLSTPIKRRASH